MANENVVRTLTVRGISEGMGQLETDLNKVASAHGKAADASVKAATTTEASAKRQLSVATSWERFRRSVDEAYGAQQRFAEKSVLAERAIAQGANVNEVNRALDLYRQKLGVASTANDNVARSTGLAAHQLTNLRSQLFDVTTSLQGGISPLTVLSQQGPQIYEALAGSKGFSGGLAAARESAAAAFSRVSPGIALFGGIGVAAGVAGVALYQFTEQQRALERALNGVGRAAGVTADGLRAVGNAGAKQGGFSGAQGIDIAAQLAGTGQISAGIMPGIIGSTQKYARAFGLGMADAGEELAKAFADPAKGADELNKRLGFLDDKTRETIRSFQAQGDMLSAQKTLFDAYNASVRKTTDTTGFFAKEIEVAKAAWSDLQKTVAKGLMPSTEDRLETLARQQRPSVDPATARRRELAGLGPASSADPFVREFGDLLRKGMTETAKALAAAQEKASIDLSGRAGDIVRARLPEIGQRSALEEQSGLLSKAAGDPEVLKRMGMSIEQVQRAAAGARFSLDNLETPLQRIATDTALAARSIEAYTFSERAAVSGEQARRAAILQGKDAIESAAEAEKARTLLIAEGNRKADDLLRSAKEGAELRGKTAYESGLIQIEQKYRRFNEENVLTGPFATGLTAASNAATRFADVLTGAANKVGGTASSLPTFAKSNAVGDDLFARIIRAEGTDKFGDPYNTSLGYMKSPKPLTSMTMSESLSWGDQIRSAQGLNSSAKGAFQIVNTTQRDAMKALGLGANDMFSEENQRAMATWINKTQGPGAWEGFKRPGAVLPNGATAEQLTSRAGTVSGKAKAEEILNYKDQQIDQKIRDATLDIERQIKALDAQEAAFGKSAAEIARAGKATELKTYFDQQHITITDELNAKINGTADAYANLVKRTEEAGDRQKDFMANMDATRSVSRDVLGGFVSDLRSGAKASDILQHSLQKIVNTLESRAIDTFVDSLFGKSGRSGGGLLGGALSSVLGGSFFGKGSSGGGYDPIGPGDVGFDPFADGGVMTSRGPVPLNRYARGGIASSPQMALFGEGSHNEAYVPLPDGRSIPVSMKEAPQAKQPQVNIHNYAAGVDIQPQITPDGIDLIVRSRIAENNARSRGAQDRSW